MRTLFALALVAVLGGCDLLGGGETVVTGTVRLKETGEPLPNIAVSLYDSGGGGSYLSPRVATTTTNEQGYYRIETNENANNNSFSIYVNHDPFDERYASSPSGSVRKGESKTYDVYLDRNKYYTGE